MSAQAKYEYWEKNETYADKAKEYAALQLSKVVCDGQLHLDLNAPPKDYTVAVKCPELRIH